jgi:hypothetical protein
MCDRPVNGGKPFFDTSCMIAAIADAEQAGLLRRNCSKRASLAERSMANTQRNAQSKLITFIATASGYIKV